MIDRDAVVLLVATEYSHNMENTLVTYFKALV